MQINTTPGTVPISALLATPLNQPGDSDATLAKAAALAPLADSAPAASSTIPTTPTTPASLVTLTAVASTSDPNPLVYETAKEIIQLRRTDDTTPAAAAVSRQLSTDLTSLRAGKTDFSVSRLFSQLGALSRETSEYSNEARSLRATTDAAGKASASKAVELSKGGNPQARVSFSVRTKDGDQIDIFVERTTGGQGDGLAFSFKVTGKLSAQEQKALEALAGKLGDVADQFFRSGTSELHGLSEFDETQFASFHIEMSKPKGDKLVTQSYDYRVDDTGRHLTAKDVDGYELTMDASLLDFLNRNANASPDVLQAYLSTITDALREYESDSNNVRFIRDAFNSMFDSNQAVSNTKSPDTLSTFATGLPDFTANISAPLHHNRHNFLYPESLELSLAQKTTLEEQDDKLKVTQTNSYELHSRKIISPITDPDKKAEDGNFTYSIRNEKRETSRELAMTGDRIDALLTTETEDVDNRDNKLANFMLVDVEETKFQRSNITPWLRQIADSNTAYNGKLAAGQQGKISPGQLQILLDSRANLLAHLPE